MKNATIKKLIIMSALLSMQLFNPLCTHEEVFTKNEHEDSGTASKNIKVKDVQRDSAMKHELSDLASGDSNFAHDDTATQSNLRKTSSIENSRAASHYDASLDLEKTVDVDFLKESQSLHDYVTKIFEKVGIMIKDFIASWSKMSSRQVEKLEQDLNNITQSATDRMLTPKLDAQSYEDAAKKASADIKDLINFDQKIESMPEGQDKINMQKKIDDAYLIVANDLANVIHFAPDSASVAMVINDLPQEVQSIVNQLVSQKQEMGIAKRDKDSRSEKGLFDDFAKSQDKSSDEMILDYKNEQSKRALAAQNKMQEKMSVKSNQSLNQELGQMVQPGALKSTITNTNIFEQQDIQTDFSGVVKDAQDQAQLQVASQKAPFAGDISQGQFKLKSPSVESTGAKVKASFGSVKQTILDRGEKIRGQEDGLTDGEDEGEEFFGKPDEDLSLQKQSKQVTKAQSVFLTSSDNSALNKMLDFAQAKKDKQGAVSSPKSTVLGETVAVDPDEETSRDSEWEEVVD